MYIHIYMHKYIYIYSYTSVRVGGAACLIVLGCVVRCRTTASRPALHRLVATLAAATRLPRTLPPPQHHAGARHAVRLPRLPRDLHARPPRHPPEDVPRRGACAEGPPAVPPAVPHGVPHGVPLQYPMEYPMEYPRSTPCSTP